MYKDHSEQILFSSYFYYYNNLLTEATSGLLAPSLEGRVAWKVLFKQDCF
jgi:hypothetical protein